jgi:peroxiredoxin
MDLTKRQTLQGIAAAAAVVLLAAAQPTIARDAVQPGKPAPEFAVKDASGKTVTLGSFKGKVVVLEWTNQDCPYVRKHYGTGNMQALQKEATADGVVWLTISSSAPGQQGHVTELEAEKLTADRKAHPTAFLLDPSGTVGRAYGATVTPHMFVIDKAGVIAYMGGIDDKPTTNAADVKEARNFVREALRALAAGEPVKTASARPYGCSIKYSAEPRS